MTTEATTTTTTPAGQVGAGASPAPTAGSTAPAQAGATTTAAPAGTQQGQEGAPAQKPAAASGELEVKVPDGAAVDANAMAQFKAFAKDAGLTSESATKVVGFYLEQQKALAAQWQTQKDTWQQANRADKDLGGDRYDANAKEVARVLGTLDKELLGDLTEFGLIHLPSLNRAAWKLRSLVKEDNSALRGAPTEAQAGSVDDQLRRQYPAMFGTDGKPKY